MTALSLLLLVVASLAKMSGEDLYARNRASSYVFCDELFSILRSSGLVESTVPPTSATSYVSSLSSSSESKAASAERMAALLGAVERS